MYNQFRETRPNTILQKVPELTPMPKKRRDWADAITKFAKGKAGKIYGHLGLTTTPIPPLYFNLSTELGKTDFAEDGTVNSITLASDLDKTRSLDEAVQIFMFEMGNVKNASKFLEVFSPIVANKKALRRLESSERIIQARQYARDNEKIEWENIKQLWKLMDNSNVFDDSSRLVWSQRPDNFSSYYDLVLSTGHAREYMIDWYAIVGKAIPKDL
jgi:hypothetical protein